ncbi:histidine phosphatase family protein [Parafrankia elaeagni]|uniref:histidine phosphatase family protein n=1 Tax=Parafrankia elaeagni TaxID=222534 RepID=UPI000475BCED|nr:histidine phosphatase family protein [Parafrankia elaeagni]
MGRLTWLVRHGESMANAGLPTADPHDIALTELGLRQADVVADAVPRAPSLVVTSSFLRARRTARPTSRRFPTVPEEIWEVQEFTYLGSLHGQNLSDRERAPFAETYWHAANPYAVDRPDLGCESFAGLMDRADRLLARLSLIPDGLVVVFSHGMFIRAVDWCLRSRAGSVDRLDMGGYREHQRGNPVPNGSIIELDLDDKELREPIELTDRSGSPFPAVW